MFSTPRKHMNIFPTLIILADFWKKIVQKSDFDDFSGKNVTVFGIKAHKAKFLFYFEGCLGIHKIYKDETDLGGVKDLTVNSIRF